jgi:hypothetical protein
MTLLRSFSLLALPLLALALTTTPACSSSDSGTSTTTGAGGSTSSSSAASTGETTGEGTGTPGEMCSYSDPPAGSTTIRLSLIGVASLKSKKASWRVREKGGSTTILAASEPLGGGPYCPAWVAADPAKSYEIDVVIDIDGNGKCDEPPTDVVLTGEVPAFVNGLAELDFVYDGKSNGTCSGFMLP